MPLYKTITVNPYTKVYIWKITESEKELSLNIELTNNCQLRVNSMKSELHRRGFLSIRHLMGLAGYVDSDLFYDLAGKPHLKDGNHISITHSYQFTGIIVSQIDEVGIDIEKQRDKIIRIGHKFTTTEAYANIKNAKEIVKKLTIIWGAKESLYKIYATHGLSFINHIYIDDFINIDNTTKGIIRYDGCISEYDISFLEFEEFTCVYAIKKEG
ncbi:4'-phosphopantetheinyl transferase superfamily protein [uncultured Eudoraea sp.]|uniref:4'-phosphopantetheinyl transferase family protein n=1 Tax=uncultured Eudoraea sp. TaxID=1035614 RepID=UPI002629A32F|nr:4'-phosphopantetheinyl transferase superfamily protein [uncultured Eudoraea sp.]